MERNQEEIISVKAVLDYECKRFGISPTETFSHFVDTLSDIFLCEVSNIQYKDPENDLISMGSEEEFVVALKCVPETGGILRVVVSAKIPTHIEEIRLCTESQTSEHVLVDTDTSMDIQNIAEGEKEVEVVETENNFTDKDTKSTSSENRKSSIRHKIESASKLSKDLNFISSEVTGRIPVLAPSSECNLDTQFRSQKPGARKVRRVSSGTASAGTDKNDKKQGRGRQNQRKKKRKHRDSSSSSSDSSSSGSSSSSSSSSSESSCEDDYCYYKKSGKKKRKESPSRNIDKVLHKCEKRITQKVAKDVDKYTKSFKEDVLASVTSAIIQKLEGAVLQSFVVPNGATPLDTGVSPGSPKVGEGFAKRLRYQHQNVVCDHCEMEIFGPRYKCGNCSDYDLCEQCEAIEGLHTPSHVFIKMHYPSVHAGRRSTGGKSRPLLRANIYEEREKEREMEDLLQRKMDSGSELNAKVMEKFEKRRLKMREAEQSREAYDNRKEEWKKMKKEIKRNKKELARKYKHQGNSLQRNVGIATRKKDDTTLRKEGFCFDIECLPKMEPKIVKDAEVTEQISDNNENKTQEEKLSSAISDLKIVQEIPPTDSQQTYEEISSTTYDDVIIDIPVDSFSDSDRVESDVVVVDSNHIPTDLELIEMCPQVETLQKPDLVDFNREVVETTTSEDFIVVSNYFDLSVPIDHKHILEHRNCESCHGENFSPECIQSQYSDACTSTANELPVDLVASVHIATRNQSDISAVNIMDQSIDCFSITSTPPISPEPLSCMQLSETYHEVNSLQSTVEFDESPIPETIVESVEILNEPSQSEVTLSEPYGITSAEAINQTSLHEEISSSDGLNIFSEITSDHVNPIIQSQIEREEVIRSNEFSSSCTETSNSFDINTPAPSDVQEHTDPTLPYERASGDVSVTTSNNGFGTAIVGAMANIVDTVSETVAHVLRSGNASPKAEYHNSDGEEVVMLDCPADAKTEGMRQLLEMGFFDRPLNDRLLETYKNDVGQCVAELLVEHDNQWYTTRH